MTRYQHNTPELLRSATEVLPTSRHAMLPEPNILKRLRSLAPHRPLTEQHAAELAEAQAALLLRLAGVHEPPTPSCLIVELPRVFVRVEPELPISAATHWMNGRWLLFINGGEPLERQRFSLCHEYKHAIDHRARAVLYRSRPEASAADQAELAADAFAAAVLMPAEWVRRAWGSGIRSVDDLSHLFEVSHRAMRRRLELLGLAPAIRDEILEVA